MSNIERWLEQNGLGKYVDLFADSEIDFDVLHQLTSDDLKELGIPLGARKRLQNAIAGLANNATDVLSDLPVDARQDEAERRHLTVLFCDLVGSTELSQRLDPEELREVSRAYQDAAKLAIEGDGGYVARYMGDGVLAYFGYPAAHEDDAERAQRGGLALVQAVLDLEAGIDLAVRVGIATGRVVVGDLIGEGASQEMAVVGETPNLAARLQAEAEPNSVVVSESTRALTRGLFEYEPLSARPLKGFAAPIAPFRLIGELRAQPRFVARSHGQLSGFVGRSEELELLMRRWSGVPSGAGHVVVISGEAGFGKSRLVHEFRQQIEGSPHRLLSFQCSPHHSNSALYPIVDALEQLLIPHVELGTDARIDAFRRTLEQHGIVEAERVGLFAYLLSVPGRDQFVAVSALDSSVRREGILRELTTFLAHGKIAEPTLLVIEDVHWADPSTRELFRRLTTASERTPTLVLATTRPGFEPESLTDAHATIISLMRLRREEVEQLALNVDAELSAETIQQVASRAVGNPLYAEELAKAAARMDDTASVPATLHDLLMSRLDAAGEGKRVAQCAAVIGRQFDDGLLSTIWGGAPEQLRTGLEALSEAGLVIASAEVSSPSHEFNHALIREVAYESLLNSSRKAFHRALALACERQYPDVARARPEYVAQHWESADEYVPAISHYLDAARRDNDLSAHREAAAHAESGLRLVLKEGIAAPAESHAELLLERARAIAATRGTAAPELPDLYRQVDHLASGAIAPRLRFRAIAGLVSYFLSAGQANASLEAAGRLRVIAEAAADPYFRAEAQRYLGVSEYHVGDYVNARHHLESSLEWFAEKDDINSRVELLRYLQWTYRSLSEYTACWRAESQLLEVAQAAGTPAHLARALASHAENLELRGEYSKLLEVTERLIALATEHELAMLGAMGALIRTHGLYKTGEAADVVMAHQAAIDAYAALGAKNRLGIELALLAIKLADIGDNFGAEEAAHRALSYTTEENALRTGMAHVWAGIALYRVHFGDESRRDSSENHMRQGLRNAREWGNRDGELHAAVAMAEHYLVNSDAEAAKALLDPISERVLEHTEVEAVRSAGDLLSRCT